MDLKENLEVELSLGLHLRPASQLVQLVSKFKSHVEIIHGDCRADARSLMGLLSMAISYGSQIDVEIHGEDAQELMKVLREYFRGDSLI